MNFETLILFGFLLIFLYLLIKGADLVESSFGSIAKRFNISEFFMGIAVLGAVSSLPEISIAVNSSKTIPELSVGNLLGATLVLLTLVIGLTVVKFNNIHFQGHYKTFDLQLGIALVIVALFTLLDREITELEGLGLFIIFPLYIFKIFLRYREHVKLEGTFEISQRKLAVLFFKSLVGLFLLLLASTMIVDIVIEISSRIEVNEALVGIFVLAVGTNLPEITILLRTQGLEQEKLALGNFLGSAFANTWILGLLTILSKGVVITHFYSLVPVMVILSITLLLFSIFSWSGRKLTIAEGMMLIGLYASFIISEIAILIVG